MEIQMMQTHCIISILRGTNICKLSAQLVTSYNTMILTNKFLSLALVVSFHQ